MTVWLWVGAVCPHLQLAWRTSSAVARWLAALSAELAGWVVTLLDELARCDFAAHPAVQRRRSGILDRAARCANFSCDASLLCGLAGALHSCALVSAST